MSDPTGLGAGLGIESVEWFAEGGENLTVRVTGRWRRRRPTWIGSPVLVIEAHGRRHRFPAMPEPPSVTGAAPGMWRMNFSVPASLAPHLRGSLWLKLGVVLLPLPTAVEAAGALVESEAAAAMFSESDVATEPERPAAEDLSTEPPSTDAPEAELPPADAPEAELAPADAPRAEPPPPPRAERPLDEGTLAERRLRSTELALEASRARLVEAEEAAIELGRQLQRLERELAEAALEPERLNQLLAERERRRRAAEQRAYAERALREELEEELAERERELSVSAGAREELAALQERVRELEEEVELLRRGADEAEQIAAAARSARARAEREAAELRERHEAAVRVPTGPQLSAGLRGELELARNPPPSRRAPPRPLPRADGRALAREREMIAAASVARDAAQARAAALERELERQAARVAHAYEAIAQLRDEVEQVRLEHQRQLLAAPEAEPVDPERLAAALTRLRTETPDEPAEAAADAAPAAPAEPAATAEREPPPTEAKPWLGAAFRTLVDEDAVAAGLLVLRLLPALRVVHPQPLAFDLAIVEVGCLRVTVGADAVEVEPAGEPRPKEQVRFTITGELASLARLLVAGRLRRLGRSVASVSGQRRELKALRELVRAPVTLGQLHDAGVRLDASLALTLISLMVKPAWTKGERFTVAYQEEGAPSAGTYLHVRGGERPSVAHETPLGAVETTIVCAEEVLLPLFEGSADDERVTVDGDQRPLMLLQDWVKRAQSG